MTLNIGIMAHVDAGKTTITEQILFASGAVRSAGNVDDGTTHTDFMEIERARGISVRTASAFLQWKGCDINIIDTPGHSDFSGEVQRSMRAVDLAVLVISAVEGIQSQTELIWKILSEMNIPVILFINKIDRTGADPEGVKKDIKDTWGVSPFSYPPSDRESIIDSLSSVNDSVLEKYLEGGEKAFSDEELNEAVKLSFRKRELFPCIVGAARRGDGIAELLDLLAFMDNKKAETLGNNMSGVVFRLDHDKMLGRAAYVRLYSGTMKNRDLVHNLTSGADEKVVQIRKVQGAREIDTGALAAGDIGVVYGLNSVKNGDVLGDGSGVPDEPSMASPVLRVKITPADEQDYPALLAAIEQLSAEDPLLSVIWETEIRELLVSVTGLVQIQILRNLLKTRFGLDAVTGSPQVIYKETPASAGYGFVEYTMPKPCWAVMRFMIEPLPAGSGVIFESTVDNDKIYLRYQSQVRQTIPEALRQGPRGWEVTDLKITLVDGEHNTCHTHPLDFILATPMGIMDGLVNTDTVLLEPVIRFRASFPEEFAGSMVGEVIAMRGEFDSPQLHKGRMVMTGCLPVATSMDFPIRLASMTGGRGILYISFKGYRKCPPGEGFNVPYRGISPLDRAKYILYKRGALGC